MMTSYTLVKIKKLLWRIYFAICPVKNKKFLRKKYLALADKKYLQKYLYALDNNQNILSGSKPNIIWTCWLQGEENAPTIVKACIQQMRRVNPNMQVIVVNRDNIKDFVTLPDYIYTKWQQGKITNTHFSDILRVCLLYEHGGTWLDSTVWLGKQIDDAIIKSPFFAYHSRTYLRIYPKVFGNNSWFLSSNQYYPLIEGIRSLLFEYWKHEKQLIHYFLYHLFFDLMVENNDFYADLWNKVPLLYDDDEALFENFFKAYDEKLYDAIINKNPVQKLSYKYTSPSDDVFTFEKYVANSLNK